MKPLENNCYNPIFSHIYVETEALGYECTKAVMSYFPKAQIIQIHHYKDVFCRSKQNYSVQKESPKLILAVKKQNLVYEGAPVCQNFGNQHFYYTSSMMNCLYNCEYCYLQGMYPSANIVVFVNLEDIMEEVLSLLRQFPMYLCISYDTDLLALEPILGYVKRWIDFARAHKDLKIELRTKSSGFYSISQLEPSDNVILAWTLSPQRVQMMFEHHTPTLASRISNIQSAIKKGWRVRLCFDPILFERDWKDYYREFIELVFEEIPPQSIEDISIGVFRVSNEYLKKMRKQKPDSLVLNFPYTSEYGIFHYGKALTSEIVSYVKALILPYIPENAIFTWDQGNDS